MAEIEKAMEAFGQHDACDDCGKRTDGLMTCTYVHDGSETKICPDCIKDSGFGYACGYYCAGSNDFDGRYCGNCRHEFEQDDDEDDENYYEYPEH